MARASTMNFTEAVAIATSSLWAHKLRSVLTLIGVVIGVTAVIAVVSLINGANQYVGGNILAQFLIEAVTLSAVGGMNGVLSGSGITLLMEYGVKFPASLSVAFVVAALVLCAMIGIVFGVYPAWKAAGLDPVEALRYE
jgi:ABC-type antimicrobial peptide transport system permease subunit